MDFTIPEEYERLRAALREFAEREVLPRLKEAKRDEYNEIDEETASWLRKRSYELGFHNVSMTEEFGGMDLGSLGVVLLREEEVRLGALNGTGGGFGIGIVGGNPNGPSKIWLACNDEQRQKYLWPLVKGHAQTAFALTEPGTGSDAQGIQTSAVQKGDSWVINGMKHFCSGGHSADFIMAIVVTDPVKRARGGVTAFIVEKDMPGFRVGRRQKTMGGFSPTELYFDDCVVPSKNVLGELGRGFYIGMGLLNEGRLAMAATCLGAAEACLKMGISYSKQRVTFGQPLSERQAIQWMLADTATELAAARLLTYSSAWHAEAKDRDIRAEAAMAKLFASEMCDRAVDKCLQIHGGIGYTTDLPIEAIYRQMRLMRIGEGSSEMMRILIARQVLKD